MRGHKLSNIPAYLIKFRYHKKSSSRQFPEVQLNNVRICISNFIKNINGEHDSPAEDIIYDILINMGVMNKDFIMDDKDTIDMEGINSSLDSILKKTIRYFNFNRREAYLMKKIFYNRMLNFIFQARGLKTALRSGLYLYCLKNYPFILENPKLYTFPLAASFLSSGKR